MKKLIAISLILFVLLAGLGCSGSAPETTTAPSEAPASSESAQDAAQEVTQAPAESAEPAQTPSPEEEAPESPTSNVLVAYFSATGTTQQVSQTAAEVMNADLYEIVPAQPYTAEDLDYNTDCRANAEMDDPDARPEISGNVENIDAYDIVFLGYPIWWGEAPRIISTFLEQNDLSGKTVVTFCTSGGSRNNDAAISQLAQGADWITGERMNGASREDVVEWIEGLGIGVTAA